MAQQLTQLCEGLGPELARQAMYWCRSVHWTSQAFQVKVACTANSSHIPNFCPTPYNQSHCTTFLQDGAVPCWPLVLRDTYDASPLTCIQCSCLTHRLRCPPSYFWVLACPEDRAGALLCHNAD